MRICVTTEPMAHQRDAVAHLKGARVGGALMDMGTGKCFVAISLAELRADRIDKVWWTCPCSLRQNVVSEIVKHTDATPEEIHVLTSKSKDAEIERATWIVVGIETVGQSDAVTLKMHRHVAEASMMIVDESTYIKGPRAKRTDRLTKLGAVCRYRLVMTGTPLTQGLVDLYAQMRFLSSKILGYASFWSFAQAHVVYRTEKIHDRHGRKRTVVTDHVIGYRDMDAVIQNVAPYVYQVRKDACLDLPDKIYVERLLELTEEQEARYEEIKNRMILDRPIDDFFGSMSSIAIFRLFSALQKVTAGVDAVDGVITPHDRVDTMLRWVGQVPTDEPVVIWTKYRAAADQIEAALREEYGDVCEVYDGRFTDRRRQENLGRWRSREKRFLLATQDSGGHGLTLVESAWSLFYADGFKYSNRLQAEDRFHRIGQTRRPTLASLRCMGTIDDRIAENHRTKGATLRDFRRALDTEKKANAKDRLMEFVGGPSKKEKKDE